MIRTHRFPEIHKAADGVMIHLCCASKVGKYEPQKRNIVLIHRFCTCMVTLGFRNCLSRHTRIWDHVVSRQARVQEARPAFCKLSWISYQIWPGENFSQIQKWLTTTMICSQFPDIENSNIFRFPTSKYVLASTRYCNLQPFSFTTPTALLPTHPVFVNYCSTWVGFGIN